MTLAILFGSLFVFLALGLEIAISLGLSVVITMIFSDIPMFFLVQKMYTSLDSFSLLAVPFFILSGEIMQRGTMANKLLSVSKAAVGHLTGSMAMISTLTCTFYGALSGSSPATVAAVGGIMIPTMHKEGYKKEFSVAVNTVSGIIGVLIPPSVPLIFYGITTNTSIGDLFKAGILPGIFFCILLMITSYVISKKEGYTGSKRASLKELGQSLWEAKYSLFLPVIILGGIYGGIFTPTEAAGVSVVYALFVEYFLHKNLTVASAIDAFRTTALTTASVFIIVATATVLGQILVFENVPGHLVEFFSGVSTNKFVLLLLINILLLIVGTFMEALVSILILAPLLLPIVQPLGVDPIHFGVIMVVNLAIGFCTPPVGVNLFVGSGIGNISIESLSKAVIPFLVVLLTGLAIINAVPEISLFLLK